MEKNPIFRNFVIANIYQSNAINHLCWPTTESHLGYASCRHTHNTRYASKQNFCESRPRTNTGKQIFSCQAVDLWRDIPYYLKDLSTVFFAKEIKHYLLSEQYSKNLNSNLSFITTSLSIICFLSLLLFFD